MSNRVPDTDQPCRIERRLTCDAVIDIWVGSRERDGAWRCVPVPPADPYGPEGWEIFDSSRDYKTEWFRRCTDHIAAARLGGSAVEGLTARARRHTAPVAPPRRRRHA